MPDLTAQEYIRQQAREIGVQEELALAVAEQESSFKVNKVGSKGELGIMQLMPETAKKYGVDPANPRQNIRGGLLLLKDLSQKYKGAGSSAFTKVVAAYNAGEGAVDKGEIPDSTLSAYIPSVRKYFDKYMKTAGPLTAGNIDLFKQPKVKNPDGSVSTVDSVSVEMDGKEYLLPTVTPDGRHFTGTDKVSQAVAEFKKTGRHLGIFPNADSATNFATQLHNDYAAGKYDKPDPKHKETWDEWTRRQARDTARVALEAIPMIGGATGGMIGGAAMAPSAAVTGPAGPYFGAVSGAAVGGVVGKAVQRYLRTVLPTSIAGPTQPGSIVADLGEEGTRQMEYEAGGRIIAAPLGFLRRGGFVTKTPEVAQTMAENARVGTRLSGPEIATGTRAGAIGERLQRYASGSFGGAIIQGEARAQGTRAAEQALERDLQTLAKPGSLVQTGESVAEGMKAAKSGLQVVGKEMEAAVAKGPKVSLVDPVTYHGEQVPAVKDVAREILERKIVPLLTNFPEQTGNAATAKLIRQLKADPQMIQRAPRPALLLVVDEILTRYKSPVMSELRNILGAEDQAEFRGMFEKRRLLRLAGGSEDALFAKKDAQALSKRLLGVFTKHMNAASPEFEQASQKYGQGAFIQRGAMDRLYKTALNNPEDVIGFIKKSATRSRQFRTAMLDVAAQGPDAAKARATFDLVRSTAWQDEIIRGGKPAPKNWEDAAAQLAGMGQRIREAERSEWLTELMGDATGKRIVANAKTVAGLIEKRTQEGGGMLRMIFEISRGVTALAGLAAGGKPGAIGVATAWEAIPDFYTWVIHNDQATKWFIDGVQAENPNVASAAVVRLLDSYRRSLRPRKPVQARPTAPAASSDGQQAAVQ